MEEKKHVYKKENSLGNDRMESLIQLMKEEPLTPPEELSKKTFARVLQEGKRVEVEKQSILKRIIKYKEICLIIGILFLNWIITITGISRVGLGILGGDYKLIVIFLIGIMWHSLWAAILFANKKRFVEYIKLLNV